MMTNQNGSGVMHVSQVLSELAQSSGLGNDSTLRPISAGSEFNQTANRLASLTPEERQRRDEESRLKMEEKRKQEAKEARRKEAHSFWVRAIKAMGVRYYDVTLDSFVAKEPKQEAVVSQLRELAKVLPEHSRKGGGIVFIGPMGTGKDHLAAAMLTLAASVHHMTVGWCDGQLLFQEFRDRIGENQREDEKIRELVRPDILLISDPIPQSGSISDFQHSVLWRVIDTRYRNLSPTWVTMNVSGRDEAEKRLGAQMVDRLGDGAVNIICAWGSYRKSTGQTPLNAAGTQLGNRTF